MGLVKSPFLTSCPGDFDAQMYGPNADLCAVVLAVSRVGENKKKLMTQWKSEVGQPAKQRGESEQDGTSKKNKLK